MTKPVVILFYKKLITLGGAEILLGEHYSWLKVQGYAPKVVCFSFIELDRIEIEADDLIRIEGSGTLTLIRNLSKTLFNLQAQQVFCHSGHIEFGLAALWARISYSVFLHQPTTMSHSETNKYALFFFKKYQNFARKDLMYVEIIAAHKALSFKQHFYINLRAILSQWVLQSADYLFVLSNYAVREKKEIFNLDTTHLSGAISNSRLDELSEKSLIKLPAEEVILMTISRLDEHKRIDLLIDAVGILCRKGHNIRLIIGGTGRAEQQLKDKVIEQGLNKQVIFLGYVLEEDINELYASMDLFVMVDWADFQITTYEVLLNNRRVLVSDDSDVDASLLESGYLFVTSANKEKLAETILDVVSSPVIWDQSKLKEFLQNYTWSNYFRNIETVLLNHV